MKKILIVLFLMFPIFIKAATCDYSKMNDYNKLATSIDYETTFNNGKYSIKVFNVYEGLYISYEGKYYSADSKNEVYINNVEPGKYITLKVYAPLDDCNSYIKDIYLQTKYYNYMYNDSRCEKYRDVLTICKYEFLTYNADDSLLTTAIENYNSGYRSETIEEPAEVEPTLLDNIKEFAMNWGIQLILGLVSTIGAVSFYKMKFRKIKHGI